MSWAFGNVGELVQLTSIGTLVILTLLKQSTKSIEHVCTRVLVLNCVTNGHRWCECGAGFLDWTTTVDGSACVQSSEARDEDLRTRPIEEHPLERRQERLKIDRAPRR